MRRDQLAASGRTAQHLAELQRAVQQHQAALANAKRALLEAHAKIAQRAAISRATDRARRQSTRTANTNSGRVAP